MLAGATPGCGGWRWRELQRSWGNCDTASWRLCALCGGGVGCHHHCEETGLFHGCLDPDTHRGPTPDRLPRSQLGAAGR